jgi:hypothetical protein
MASANPLVNINRGELLERASKLATPELEILSKEISRLVAKRRQESASEREAVLLSKISKPLLSPLQQKKYKTLLAKQQSATISSAENKEFLALIHEQERNGVERLKSMIELSRLREVSFDQLLEQLGLTAPFPENA